MFDVTAREALMWDVAAADRWVRLADDGCIHTPPRMINEAAAAVYYHILLSVRQGRPLDFVIDTIEGDSTVWRMAKALEQGSNATTATVTYRAYSAGLVLACACSRRTATPHAQFLYHGLNIRNYQRDDERRAQWFGERTHRDAEFWLDLCSQGDTVFDARQALEWGVIHEIRE